MDDTNAPSAKVPTQFWIVAVIGLLWNCIGAYFYLMARLDPGKVMGDAPPEMLDYVNHMPLWANIGYGLQIFETGRLDFF